MRFSPNERSKLFCRSPVIFGNEQCESYTQYIKSSLIIIHVSYQTKGSNRAAHWCEDFFIVVQPPILYQLAPCTLFWIPVSSSLADGPRSSAGRKSLLPIALFAFAYISWPFRFDSAKPPGGNDAEIKRELRRIRVRRMGRCGRCWRSLSLNSSIAPSVAKLSEVRCKVH